ncbi:MAG: PUR family DNA/RNA-binding protein [Spirochaetia bacterium]|nr:PUR family DNA/RNA-binding protein [Spirochaetia bacterium]
MAIRGEIFSSQVITEKRTYFFNVKEDRTGSHFLNLVESKKMPNGSFERHSVMVYEEDIDNFMRELSKAVRMMDSKKKKF